MMNSDHSAEIHAFATFRVAGDTLDPNEVTNVLRVRPTHAHRKGEAYRVGSRGAVITPRTGVWYLSTQHLVESSDLRDHFNYLLNVLDTTRRQNLRGFLRE